ncbi:MAG: hypothetical protein AAB958_02390 [Patescibacteria group bacterium]
MKIAILGSGPSGMFAAHASSQCGAYIDIFDADPDKTRRSSGVYYLHDSCDLLLDEIKIKQSVLGTRLMTPEEIKVSYGMKVYGKLIEKVSILDAIKTKEVVGYNSSQAIERLWDLYGKQVQLKKIESLRQVLEEFSKYDLIISTIPVYVLYPDLVCEGIETSIKVGKSPEKESFIFYNVNRHCKWYRCSAMFGTFIQEYGFGLTSKNLEGYEYKKVIKVIGDGYKSPNKNIFLVGRYGAWDKSCLTHNVYHRTLEYLINR